MLLLVMISRFCIIYNYHIDTRGRRGRNRMELQRSMQSVPITSNVVSSIKHYVTGRWFSRVLLFPPPIKLTAAI